MEDPIALIIDVYVIYGLCRSQKQYEQRKHRDRPHQPQRRCSMQSVIRKEWEMQQSVPI